MRSIFSATIRQRTMSYTDDSNTGGSLGLDRDQLLMSPEDRSEVIRGRYGSRRTSNLGCHNHLQSKGRCSHLACNTHIYRPYLRGIQKAKRSFFRHALFYVSYTCIADLPLTLLSRKLHQRPQPAAPFLHLPPRQLLLSLPPPTLRRHRLRLPPLPALHAPFPQLPANTHRLRPPFLYISQRLRLSSRSQRRVQFLEPWGEQYVVFGRDAGDGSGRGYVWDRDGRVQ